MNRQMNFYDEIIVDHFCGGGLILIQGGKVYVEVSEQKE